MNFFIELLPAIPAPALAMTAPVCGLVPFKTPGCIKPAVLGLPIVDSGTFLRFCKVDIDGAPLRIRCFELVVCILPSAVQLACTSEIYRPRIMRENALLFLSVGFSVPGILCSILVASYRSVCSSSFLFCSTSDFSFSYSLFRLRCYFL